MPQVQENYIKFGYVTKEEMNNLISQGKVSQYDIIFSKDTGEQFIISSNLSPIPIKSRVRIYNSVSEAESDINTTSQTYSGEIVSIFNETKYSAYIVNREGSNWVVNPITSDGVLDYNELNNVPIVQLYGTSSSPIILSNLNDGHYKAVGTIKTPDNRIVNSVIGNYVIVQNYGDNKKIKRIGTSDICDYVINDNETTINSYTTESYLTEKGYATESFVTAQLDAFKLTMEEYVREYVTTTVSLLIGYMVDQELDSRYASKEDIDELFE